MERDGKDADPSDPVRSKILVPSKDLIVPPTPFVRRMMEFRKGQIPPWHPDAAAFQARMAKLAEADLKFKLRLAETWSRLPIWLDTRMRGGSGLLMSRTLRTFFYDYANRIVNHGPFALPLSFNVVESFLRHDTTYCVFDVRPEIEHLLAADDYMDWYAENKMPVEPRVLTDVLKDGVIYSYDMISDPIGYRISTDKSAIVIAGISLVRHDNELSCLLIAGENPAIPSDAEAKKDFIGGKPFRGKEKLAPHPALGIENRYLDTYPDFSRIVVLTRFDLRAKKHDVRYIYRDLGNRYNVLSDDESIYGEMSSNVDLIYEQRVRQELARYDGLFSALAALIYLPVAFVAETQKVHEEKFTTELFSDEDDAATQKAIKKLGEKECVRNRAVRCLATNTDRIRNRTTTIRPPELSFQSEGFWKSIGPGEIGIDRNNQPIIGKTWVVRTEAWSAHSPREFLLTQPDPLPVGPDPGTVYVVRSPAHEIDLYKVGLTRRSVEQRVKELHSTGTPLPFGILAKWEVGDCVAVEKEIHLDLAAYRVDPRREFFRTNLDRIIKVVNEVIARQAPQ